MIDIYQTDDFWGQYADENPHEWCYFLSNLYLFEWKLNLGIWTHECIEQIWEEAEKFHILDTDGATVLDPQGLCDQVGGKSKMHYQGHEPADFIVLNGEAEIGVWHAPGSNFNHFVVMDNGSVKYDPWSANGSNSVKNGAMIESRIWTLL